MFLSLIRVRVRVRFRLGLSFDLGLELDLSDTAMLLSPVCCQRDICL